MSITKNIYSSRLLNKLRKAWEYIKRELNTEKMKIFFTYSIRLNHPVFKHIVSNPPIKYSNLKKAKLLHLIQGPSKELTQFKPFIIEQIDHVLSPVARYCDYTFEPEGYVQKVKIARDIYASELCKKIILVSKGQSEVFKRYINEEAILNKITIIPIAWKNNLGITKQINNSEGTNFLFIASNYLTKGCQIVLEAWKQFCLSDQHSTLTLVSHDLPYEMESTLERVNVIKEIPLKAKTKNSIYSQAEVVIATTLTDGVTPVEAMSYGLPIIVFRTQHSKDYIKNGNGFEIDVPINIYDKEYGKEWKTNQDYVAKIKDYLNKGLFSDTINNLTKTFKLYSTDKELINIHKERTEQHFMLNHTIELRNKKLLEIYKEVY
ncbi:glycosyltransferase [Candidatus Margulisiibacteriota bacterium]